MYNLKISIGVILSLFAFCNCVNYNENNINIICRYVNNGDIIELQNILNDKMTNINSVDESGYTPLSYACLNGNLEMAKMLLKHGADINYIDGYPVPEKAQKNIIIKNYGNVMTILARMSLRGNCRVVKFLIDNNADMDKVPSDVMGAETPLRMALFNDKIDVAELLFNSGCKLSEDDIKMAIRCGHLDIAKKIRDKLYPKATPAPLPAPDDKAK